MKRDVLFITDVDSQECEGSLCANCRIHRALAFYKPAREELPWRENR